ncbi:tRNA 2-selenouridine(34) synthase MnmH [Candidatus Woesearchaeota archaeon]|nr:tRNA 2-selenouridine(34) synthase MnmH [Candidatus Woesearchaeota archaeon]
MVNTIEITEALKLPSEDVVFVDTRSPKEFAEDNIPGAINIPIFSNEERAIIGTLYKNNQVEAYQQGFGIYNSKILDFIEQFKQIPLEKKIIIYCWRGGMRSKTIAELIASKRTNVYQLIGGYKQFRAVVREELKNYEPPFTFIVLQGLAGCGKTDLIKKLFPTINLEGYAHHRSSLFGALGLKPVSQKMFESRLWKKLHELESEKIVFIEGEAKKIGDIFVPEKIYETMQTAPTVNITASITTRSKRIVQDYFTHNEDEEIKKIIMKLKVYLSTKRCEELCALVDEKKYKQLAEALLIEHYDKQYKHALTEQKYIAEICSDNIDAAVKELEQIKAN